MYWGIKVAKKFAACLPIRVPCAPLLYKRISSLRGRPVNYVDFARSAEHNNLPVRLFQKNVQKLRRRTGRQEEWNLLNEANTRFAIVRFAADFVFSLFSIKEAQRTSA